MKIEKVIRKLRDDYDKNYYDCVMSYDSGYEQALEDIEVKKPEYKQKWDELVDDERDTVRELAHNEDIYYASFLKDEQYKDWFEEDPDSFAFKR